MKIQFVISHLGTGGAEKVLVMLANHFDSIGHEISVVTVIDEERVNELNASVALTELNMSIDSPEYPSRYKYYSSVVSALRENMRRSDPDVVMSLISRTNILATIAARLEKKPIIVSEHAAFFRGNSSKFWGTLRRIVYPYADALALLTEEDMPKYGFVKNRLVIHNPLVLQNAHSEIKREKMIIAAGRLDPVKGFDMLIEAFSKLNSPDWRLVILGSGEEMDALKGLTRTFNVESKVTFTGQVSDVELYYKRASIFVLSSRSEGFPGVLCEAMAYGCASVAFDCPTGPKEIITDGVDGILVEPNNIDILAEKIQYLMDNNEIREEMGQSSKKIAERLDISAVGEKWMETIASVLEKRK